LAHLPEEVPQELEGLTKELFKRIADHRPERKGCTQKVLFLTPPESDGTIELKSEVDNDLTTPFTMGQRYVSLKALEGSPETTSDLLKRYAKL